MLSTSESVVSNQCNRRQVHVITWSSFR